MPFSSPEDATITSQALTCLPVVSGVNQESNLLRRIFTNAVIMALSILSTLLALEAIVRLGGETDADGQFSFAGYALEPYALRVSELRAGVEGYLANESISAVIYDEKLGWTFRPNTVRQGGSFTINGAGFRATRDYPQKPPPDTLRIALFGDSFTAGDDVADDETWGYHLQRLLNDAGLRAEALNFGVGAYGMDQAFLRWQELGRDFQPDIVVFGLQPENLARNLNVFRQLLHGSGPPFSKPRFVIVNQGLHLINSPALPPQRLIAAFEDFGNHPLARYEYHYASRYAASNWWASSRLASLLYATLKSDFDDLDIYGRDTEGGRIGNAILDAFARDAADHHANFVVVHLPLRWHLEHYHLASPQSQPPFQFLLDYTRANFRYVATEERFTAKHLEDGYWTPTRHYGPSLHLLVAEAVAHELIDCLDSGACH